MKTIIVDPFPREMDLIFKPNKIKLLKKNFKIINAPSKNKLKFYKQHISEADFIIGQPDLPKSILTLASKLKAIFNVESNFMDNMDYDYCFKNNIYVLSTAPVFAQSVAEIAVGLTISLKRDIHKAHLDFFQKKEKYGLESNLRSSLLLDNKIGFIGFGDLAKSLKPMLMPYTSNFKVYDPWLPNKLIEANGCKSASLKEIFKDCDVVYVLATITTKNKSMIDKKLLKLMKKDTCLLILSRASVINFQDLNEILNKDKIKVATDVFPQEPVPKNDPIRKKKNILFSAHRAGALESVFFEMGDIVCEDLLLMTKGLPPRLCRRAELETVKNLRSKPVDIN
jgi:phosphoglycerate dehydrogenase-like enzyme